MLKDLLLWLYWRPFRRLVQRLPAAAAYRAARALGAAASLVGGRRRRAYELELAALGAGARGGRERRRIIRETFVNLVSNEIEVLRFPVLNAGNIADAVACDGLEHLDAALARGRGAILLFGHFGANQMIMPAVGYRGYPMSQMSAPPTVWVEKLPHRTFSGMERAALQLRWEHEQSLPVRHINIFGSLKAAFAALKRNEVLGIAVDGGGGAERVTVPFLGRQALMAKGAIDIALRTGCAVLPTFMLREGSGRNRMIVEPALELQRGPDADAAIRHNLRLFVERFEAYVLRHPGHYLDFLSLRRRMQLQGDTPLFPEEKVLHENIAGATTV